MTDNLISISLIGNYLYCPYSIYLHDVCVETDRILNNLIVMIEDTFAKKFGGGDSVIIFDASAVKLKKYGNALHRDADILYF